MFKIITLDLTRIGRMQLSCKSKKLSGICSKSSLKSNLDQDSMFKDIASSVAKLVPLIIILWSLPAVILRGL